jgi:zinc transport system substrate-binding protein
MVNSAYSTSSINTTDGNTTLPQGSNTPDLDNNNGSKIKVVASFYPIYEFVKKVGGDKVDVSILIPVGVEPHDFEPTIQQIQEAENANFVIYNGAGLEVWIERIITKLRVDVSNGT